MKVFDFNIHLPHKVKISVEETIYNEIDITANQLTNVFKQQLKELTESIEAANFMIFNSELFNNDESLNFTNYVLNNLPESYFTLLVDYKKDNIEEYLINAKAKGVKLIKFHSYIQKISYDDFQKVLFVAKIAGKLNMPVCIDASYGTTGMYKFDNLKLAALIAENISNVPIIILHSGGSRIFEAMLIADERKNVFLETSFSIEFYKGSSIENDFAFAYKKIGIDKILFGSDSPYINNKTALKNIIYYLEHNRFTDNDIENILFANAKNLING